jgi:hypothetical protein
VDVRLADLGVAARSDRPDGVSLGDSRTLSDRDRAEVRERDGVAVAGEDGDALAGGGDRSRERDRSSLRRDHRGTGIAGDVDAAMLSGGIRMSRVEGERLHDVTTRRPRPGTRGGGEQEYDQHSKRKNALHRHLRELVVRTENVRQR